MVPCFSETLKWRQNNALTAGAPKQFLILALRLTFLDALLLEMELKRRLFSRFVVQIAEGKLTATAWGEPVDAARHQPAVEVKAATYTRLRSANVMMVHGWRSAW